MKTLFVRLAVVLGSFIALPVNAAIYHGEVAEDAYVTFGGYDLAWASPCSDGILEGSCGAIDMSEQSAYGWEIMTSSLFSELGLSADTFRVDYTSANTFSYGGANYAGATGWFSNNYTHIDVSNGISGLWSFADVADSGTYYETIVYRVNGAANVSEPGTFALLAASLLGFAATRRRKA